MKRENRQAEMEERMRNTNRSRLGIVMHTMPSIRSRTETPRTCGEPATLQNIKTKDRLPHTNKNKTEIEKEISSSCIGRHIRHFIKGCSLCNERPER